VHSSGLTMVVSFRNVNPIDLIVTSLHDPHYPVRQAFITLRCQKIVKERGCVRPTLGPHLVTRFGQVKLACSTKYSAAPMRPDRLRFTSADSGNERDLLANRHSRLSTYLERCLDKRIISVFGEEPSPGGADPK